MCLRKPPLSHLFLAIGPGLGIFYRQHLILVSRDVSGADLNNGELIGRTEEQFLFSEDGVR